MSRGRVVVVGGGPAGSATAWRLAREGVEVVVLDRARFPRDKACAEYLSPECGRILQEMGALDAVERAGAVHLTGMIVRSPSGTRIHGEFGGTRDSAARGSASLDATSLDATSRDSAARCSAVLHERGLALRRTVLDAILLDHARAAGAEVREGVRVTDVETDAAGRVRGVRVLDGGRASTLRADLVVAADGLRSVVARRLGLHARARLPNRIALVAHYRGARGFGTTGEMHVERDGYCGIAEVGGGESILSLVVPARRARELAGDPAGFLDRWVAARPQLAPRHRDAERVGRVLTTGPFATRARRPWAPGALLVGDAAGYFDPFTGGGIHAALRGAELLAPHALDALDHLARGDRRAADRALAGYTASRRRAFAGSWVVDRMIAAVVARPALIDRAARVLSRRRDMADLLVGVTGAVVPARRVLTPGYLLTLFLEPRWRV